MKILHCIWSLNTGGTEEMLIDIVGMQSKSHDVHVAIINNDFSPAMVAKLPRQVTVHYIHRSPGSKSPIPLLRLNMLVLRLLPDAIHLHNRELPSLVLPLMRWRKVLTVHALDLQLSGRRDLRRIVAISEAVADDLRARYGIDACVVANGVDTDRIHVRPCRPYAGTFKLVQVARLDMSLKGQDILIRAVGEVRRRGYDDVRLTLIGTGHDAEALVQIARAEGVGDIVTFAGLRDKQAIYKELRDYDLMVHPSRWEGFGLTIAEAMAAGLPVAVPRGGGPYEVTDKGRLGLVFEPDDVMSCADAIVRAHDHYADVLARVPDAKAYVEQNFSIKRTVSQYETVYRAVRGHRDA